MIALPRRLPRLLACLLIAGFPLLARAVPPVAPGDLRYEIYSSTAAELFWNRSTNVPVAGYEITRNGESLGLFDSLSYFDDTLTRSVDYTYAVTAVGTNGERSRPSTVSLRTPRTEDTIASLERTVRSLEREIEALESRSGDGVRAPVPRTGQRSSFRSGDDGDLQRGAPFPEPRFTVNVTEADDLNGNGACDPDEVCDGTVTDELTGLVWLQDANCYGGVSWLDAIDGPRALSSGGSPNCGLNDGSEAGDWRLPNIREMQSLLDYSRSFPEPLLSEGHPFTDVQVAGIVSRPASYWTSTATGEDGTGAYTVSVAVGWVERLVIRSEPDSVDPPFVWPVRDAR